jgi:transcriptional regulator with PAS, ATPase and Fis domain
VADRLGLVETAHGGTLFLDEAGELPLHTQAKLLRVLDSGEVRRVGATQARRARFRLIAAVQEEPCALLRGGRWRQDFFYRVTGVVLRVPALREHSADVAPIARAFLASRGLPGLQPDAVPMLEIQPWPGNVRELQQTLVRAAFHSTHGVISALDVGAALEDGGNGHRATETLCLDAVRHRHVREMVEACGGDTRSAAALLNISRSQVYRILREQVS